MTGRKKWLTAWRGLAGVAAVCTGLLAGCGDRQEEAVGGLAGAGFGFSVRDYLRSAAEGRADVVEMFLTAGMAVDAASSTGETALMRAVDNRHLDLVNYLLARGAKADVLTLDGETTVLKAARGGDAELVQAVLESGADPMLKNSEGWSPLTVAAYDGDVDVVKVLAPLCREYLDNALQLASVSGGTEVADVLLNNGASVFARSPDNQTALMYAAENGHIELVKLLLRNGANRFALDPDDRTASELAAEAGHSGIADYLQEPELPEERQPDPADVALWGEGEPEPLTVAAGAAPRDDGGLEVPVSEGELAEAAGNGGVPVAGDRDQTVPGGAPTEAGGPGPVAVAVAEESEAPSVQSPAPRRVAPRLDGAVIPLAREGVPVELGQEARLEAYRETQLPVILTKVQEKTPAGSGSADVRVLYGGHREPVEVPVGEVVPDTDLEVVEVRRRFVYSKQGKGEAVDVSEMILLDRNTGTRHLVRKDFPAGASETYAVMRLADGEAYDVRTQDEFSVEGQAGRYRVIDVRPTQIVIEDSASGDAITVQRFNTAAR